MLVMGGFLRQIKGWARLQVKVIGHRNLCELDGFGCQGLGKGSLSGANDVFLERTLAPHRLIKQVELRSGDGVGMELVDYFFVLGGVDRSDGIGRAEARCNDRHLEGLVKVGVFANAHNDVYLAASLVLNVVVDFADFIECYLMLAASRHNQKQHRAGSFNVVVVQERAVKGTAHRRQGAG